MKKKTTNNCEMYNCRLLNWRIGWTNSRYDNEESISIWWKKKKKKRMWMEIKVPFLHCRLQTIIVCSDLTILLLIKRNEIDIDRLEISTLISNIHWIDSKPIRCLFSVLLLLLPLFIPHFFSSIGHCKSIVFASSYVVFLLLYFSISSCSFGKRNDKRLHTPIKWKYTKYNNNFYLMEHIALRI